MKALKALSTSGIGPFPNYPGKYVIDEFKAWVRDTGIGAIVGAVIVLAGWSMIAKNITI